MVVSVAHALDNMRHTLGGGDLSVELDKIGILNQAGEFMVNMHPWRWLVGTSALINLRGVVTGTTATWTASTLTLTDTGAFTDYTFVAGDKLEIISGTGATTGFYEVASRTDDDSVVLQATISSSDLATGDIQYRLEGNSAALPDNFRDIIAISATDALLYGVRLTSLEQILQNRTSQIEVTTSWNYQAAVNYAGSPPVPRLEIWPTPTTNQTGVFTMFYRSGWTRLLADSVNIEIPEFVDSLFLRIVRYFTRGYEREDVLDMSQMLHATMQSPEFIMAAKRDGNTQPFYGKLRGGAAGVHSRHFGANKYAYIANTIGAPSA
jgi:hypothetical protein